MSARQNSNGITELMVAVLDGRPQAVGALLRRGAYADARNAAGWTALMMAERKGHVEVARLLRAGRPERPLPPHIAAEAGEARLSGPPVRAPEGARDV